MKYNCWTFLEEKEDIDIRIKKKAFKFIWLFSEYQSPVSPGGPGKHVPYRPSWPARNEVV